ncbi:hypothetical protein FRC02_006103 [Tulasnella sp. 418]|nr:hypothetical protein FRC02_006103 [Tulasnella sp. 418]
MAIAYLTAPASLVDAERAFSQGRLAVNHLQHDISSNEFRAKMSLRSWANAPFMHSMSQLGQMLANA